MLLLTEYPFREKFRILLKHIIFSFIIWSVWVSVVTQRASILANTFIPPLSRQVTLPMRDLYGMF